MVLLHIVIGHVFVAAGALGVLLMAASAIMLLVWETKSDLSLRDIARHPEKVKKPGVSSLIQH